MKKCSSLVWRFFERIAEDSRCVAVVCKLCETQYKYFGNTTNLRSHLLSKHPIQWELSQNGSLDDSQIRIDGETSTPQVTKRRKYSKGGRKDKNVDVLANSDSDLDEDNDATANLVRQMHGDRNSDEEWLEEDPYQITHIETYEPTIKKMKYRNRKIKREVTSPNELSGYFVTPNTSNHQRVVYEDTKKDEYSVFGEYVAKKLKKFSSPRTRGNLQQLITTILWQAEYGLYDNAETVKRVLMFSIQSNENPEGVGTVEYETQIQTEEIIPNRDDMNQSI